MFNKLLIYIKLYGIIWSKLKERGMKMDALVEKILALVEQILAYFNEVDAAAVVDMVKEFIANLGL